MSVQSWNKAVVIRMKWLALRSHCSSIHETYLFFFKSKLIVINNCVRDRCIRSFIWKCYSGRTDALLLMISIYDHVKWTVHFLKSSNFMFIFRECRRDSLSELFMNNLLPEPLANVFENKFIEKRLLYRINIIYVQPSPYRRKYDFGNSIVFNFNSFWYRNSEFWR